MTEGYRPNIKGVIFDKDGTLYNYSQVWGPVVKDYVDTILKTFSVRNEKKARQEIFEIIGVDSLGYLNADYLDKLADNSTIGFCKGCFTGEYPCDPPCRAQKSKFEQKIGREGAK